MLVKGQILREKEGGQDCAIAIKVDLEDRNRIQN